MVCNKLTIMNLQELDTLAFIGNLGSGEIIIICAVLLLLFGSKKLPELFRSFGKATKEFKRGRDEVVGDIRNVMDQEPDNAIDHQDHQDDEVHSETVSEPEKERT